ncbi:hypothetical protein APHACPA_0421 [Rickettsia amblyommatis str. Ac/Pa]|uniref:Uncharacterized protein n=1 Tax=Rickettsia amblyommatis str. Ac/Pa TaxID=1359164 RepID=A0A0F3N064_RICAM|nr:hypothetical protein APHACPA_0421 [Rickettsia amblyommatis str. Ac/Pa]
MLRQNLQFCLAMTDKPIHATMPSGNDIEQKQSGIKILSYIPFYCKR